MPKIHTLVEDIYDTIKDNKQIHIDVPFKLGRGEDRRTLRLSQMGPRCPRELWYMVNEPEKGEVLPPYAQVKFAYGHMIEAMAIQLAKEAGHEVTGEQDELIVDGVVGHRDCVIDGHVCDVKSCSSFAFAKFKNKTIAEQDSFGYLDQLDGYMVGSADDPLVTMKDTAYILAVDKTLGHMVLYEHKLRESSIRNRIKAYKAIVGQPAPPACTCGVVPHGKSGNLKLDTKASYSLFKHCCFPNLRTFLYADGPVYLVRVAQRPNVIEVNKEGRVVAYP